MKKPLVVLDGDLHKLPDIDTLLVTSGNISNGSVTVNITNISIPDMIWKTFDGTDNTITLDYDPIGKVYVWKDGTVLQKETTDYTVSGKVITLTETASNLNGIDYCVTYNRNP